MPSGSTGLLRTVLAPSPARMSEVLHALKRSSYRYRFDALEGLGLYGGRIPLHGRTDGAGWELLEFEGKAYAVICDCMFEEERSELIPSEELTEFHYTVTGPALVADQRSEVSISDLNLIVCRAGADATYRVTCLRGRRRSVALYLQDGFLDLFLDEGCDQLRELREVVDAIGLSHVYFRAVPINHRVAELVDQLIRNPYGDQRRLFFAEAKCTELICETIELWRTQRLSPPGGLVVTPRDLESLEYVRGLILKDLATVHSIDSLARKAGLNSTKLKAGFKFLFGCTIYQFTLKARMEHALQLLTKEKLPVGTVADQVGYQHQSSFTFAFGQYFGFPPARAHAAKGSPAPGRSAGRVD